MRLFYWIDRYAEVYGLFAATLVFLVLFVVANQAERSFDADRDVQLAEKLVSYASTLENGTVNSRAMGATILLGQENLDAKKVVLGKLPIDAPEIMSTLDGMRSLFFTDVALLTNQQGEVVAYSSQESVHGTGRNLLFRPYVQLALHGTPTVYPAVGSINPVRGIFLSAPVRAGLDKNSKPVGVVAVRINAHKIDDLLATWTGGPAVLLSPQGVVFASSRPDWLFRMTGSPSEQKLQHLRELKQFGSAFEQGSPQPQSLPFALTDVETEIDGSRYIVHGHPLEWGDPAGDWTLAMLDKRDPWWLQWKAMGLAGLAGLIGTLLLFWLRTLARNAALQHETHRDLAIAAATFESREGVIITDAEGLIVKVNHAFTQITGYTSEEAVGQKPSMLSSGRHNAEFYAHMWDRITHDNNWSGEIWNRRKNGEIYPEQLSIAPIYEENGKVSCYVGIFSDITQRKANEQEIMNLAFYDPLTGLPNRRLLNERLMHAMAASKRNGHYGALMFMDMDKFKQLNDTHGHSMGDLLLIEVAHRISGCVREADTVARFGGDEFVVMLSDLDADREKSIAQAEVAAEKIRAVLAQPYVLTMVHGSKATKVEHQCSSSIGVVLFSGQAASPEEILKWADIAMYQAKSDGRNTVRFHE
jgi:diguanylate cyclase (GGDEF)-like protein/PAS domain S-box-containing protein